MTLTMTVWDHSRSLPRRTGAEPGIGLISAAVLLFVMALFPAPTAAQTASIGVGSAQGNSGTSVDLGVNFTPGTMGVATVQFDLRYSSVLTHVSTTTGSAAEAAGKSASSRPITGGIRVLVFDLNQQCHWRRPDRHREADHCSPARSPCLRRSRMPSMGSISSASGPRFAGSSV